MSDHITMSQLPMERLPIRTAKSGFFKGLCKAVVFASLAITVLFLAWVLVADNAGALLRSLQTQANAAFGRWYIYVSTFYLLLCLGVAIWPASGSIKLGQPGERPDFSRFSWFSMMFGAGLGVGMLTYAVGEPIFHFKNNPEVITGIVDPLTVENIRPAFKWTLLHYGLTAWAIYGLVGLVMAYFAFNRGQPLTIRAGLTPLLGERLSGPIGHIIDVTAIIATITGVGYTIALGVKQFAFGLHNITQADWIIPVTSSEPVLGALLFCLLIIMAASTASAVSGVGKGIKWLSNLNMGLSLFLLLFFAVFGIVSGALGFAAKHYVLAIYDYLIALPDMSVTVWDRNGSTTDQAGEIVSNELAGWQGGWSILYWAWWIAFAPFVGLFLARVSRGRTIREFVLGAMIAPAMMCLVWFTLAGGTAIHAELYGSANGSIVGSDLSAQLFETINVILVEGSGAALLMSTVVVILLITYLVTSADSAILVITTIASGGTVKRRKTGQILFWSTVLALVIGCLLAVGGLGALRAAMLIGALPFSVVVALMGVSLVMDLRSRRKEGIAGRQD